MTEHEALQGTDSSQMQAGMAAGVSGQVPDVRDLPQGLRHRAGGPGTAGHGGPDPAHGHHCHRGAGDLLLGVMGGGLH